MKRTPLKRRTPLKSKTPLKRTKPMRGRIATGQCIKLRSLKGHNIKPKPIPFLTLNKVSKKQAKENALWSKVKKERIEALVKKFGYILCEWCKASIPLTIPDAHHNDGDRANNTFENCRILSRDCHTYVTDNNIKNVPNLLEEKQ